MSYFIVNDIILFSAVAGELASSDARSSPKQIRSNTKPRSDPLDSLTFREKETDDNDLDDEAVELPVAEESSPSRRLSRSADKALLQLEKSPSNRMDQLTEEAFSKLSIKTSI